MAGRKFDKCILSEDGTVKFDFMTSLQNIVMAKIINHLWMNKNTLQDVVHVIHRPKNTKFSFLWLQVKNKIFAKISKLPLPKFVIANLYDIVPVLGSSILDWIRYHERIMNTRDFSAVDQISCITWTARGKIDYAQTAKNILAAKDTCLCDDLKYKLACLYCLEDEIAILAPNVVNQYYLDSVQIRRHPMLYFWTAHITGDNTKLNYHYHNHTSFNIISIHEYVMLLLIDSNKRYEMFNEVPIVYMWGKLSKEEKAKYIAILVETSGNPELILTLLSSLDFEKQQEVFKACSETILLYMINDWLWREYFLPTALSILEEMEPSGYLIMLKQVTKEMIKNSQEENKNIYNKYCYIFKQLWQEASEDLNDFIVKRKNGSFLQNLLYSLPWERNMDVIRLIFSALNTNQKKETIFKSSGLHHCVDLIKKDQWDLLEMFINYTLSSEEDVNQLKEKMIECRLEEITKHFLKKEELDKLERFLTWAFACKSSEEAISIRQRFEHTGIFEFALESFTEKKKRDFTKFERLFEWCAKNDLKLINRFKGAILNSTSFSKLIENLLKKEQYEFIDQLLNWCFFSNQIKIMQYKSNMYKDSCLWIAVKVAVTFFIRTDNSLKMLDNFSDWCFTKEQEVQEFKMWFLNPSEPCTSTCTNLLIENQFELADKIIRWRVKSDEDITKFKNMLMLSEEIKIIFHWFKQDLFLLIKWFHPSEELVESFKIIFSEKDCPKYFYNLLDDYLQNHRNVLENNKFCKRSAWQFSL